MPFDFFRKIDDVDYSNNLLTVNTCPTKLEDLLLSNPKITETLIKYRDTNNIPNLILSGSPGTGKRTTVDILTKTFLREHHKTNCFYLDGSIDRGKNVVSELQTNSKKKQTNPNNNINNFLKRRTIDKFKLVVIYDFDHMSQEAQMALRRIIESQSNHVRFIFVANEHDNIIEAIQSRTVIIKFEPFQQSVIKSKLKKHAEDKITDDIIDLISIITCGDLKQSLNYLQIITNIDEPTIDKVYDIFEIPRIESINEIISSCLSKKIADKQKPYLLMQSLLDEGHDCDDILDVFLKVLTMTDLKIDDKTRMLKAVSKCYYITEYTQTNHHLFSMISECRG